MTRVNQDLLETPDQQELSVTAPTGNAQCGGCGWRGDSSSATSRYVPGAGAGYKCPSCGSGSIHIEPDEDEDVDDSLRDKQCDCGACR